MKTRCIIVDDEPLAIETIQLHIEKFDSLKIVATCTDAINAFNILRNGRIDLMFLDIQMPEMTGLEFLKALKNPPKVIFTTAYREYAIDAFDQDVVDYLLKPISFDRFMQAVNKYFEGIPGSVLTGEMHAQSSDNIDFFYVKAEKKYVKIKATQYSNKYSLSQARPSICSFIELGINLYRALSIVSTKFLGITVMISLIIEGISVRSTKGL